jgi:hypothetical protein
VAHTFARIRAHFRVFGPNVFCTPGPQLRQLAPAQVSLHLFIKRSQRHRHLFFFDSFEVEAVG